MCGAPLVSNRNFQFIMYFFLGIRCFLMRFILKYYNLKFSAVSVKLSNKDIINNKDYLLEGLFWLCIEITRLALERVVWECFPIRPYKSHYAPLLMNPRWQHSHRYGISNIKRMQRTFVKVLVKWWGLCAKINVLEKKMWNIGKTLVFFRQCLENRMQE